MCVISSLRDIAHFSDEEGGELMSALCALRDWAHAQPAPATQQAGATKEHVRLVRVIADKIEDGTLFRSGVYSNKDLASFVRNVADAAAPQFPTAQEAESVQEDAARLDWIAMYGTFGVDSATGEAGGNGQKHIAATRKNIDAARKQGATP